MSKTMVLKPRMSEKTYGLSQSKRVFVFDVPKDANKHTVASAVAAQFSVTVESVNISNRPAKAKRAYRKRGGVMRGEQQAIKKAYVLLAEGQSIPVFAAVEQSEKDEAKAAEKAAKKQAKESK